jgi:hypothetical protein
MTIRVLDPRVDPDLEPLALAPAAVLDGATIGLLDNAKIGTASFYNHLEDLLRKHGVREFIRRRKPDTSRPPPAMSPRLAVATHRVGIGTGELLVVQSDALAAERRGIPAAALITDRFIPSAKEIASIEGLPDYPFAVIAHPISGTPTTSESEAEQALGTIVRILSSRA